MDELSLTRPNLTSDAIVHFSPGSSFTLPDGTSVSGVEALRQLETGSGNDVLSYDMRGAPQGTYQFNAGSGNDSAALDFSTFASDVEFNATSHYGAHAQTGYNGSSYDYDLTLYNFENFTIIGGSGNDAMYASQDSIGGNDSLVGNGGNDYLYGYGGDDTLSGGLGADYLDGGGGTDVAVYSTSKAGVSVDLLTGVGSGGDAQGDTLTGIENLIGSTASDSLTGDSNDNVFSGQGGNDTLDRWRRRRHVVRGQWS